MGSSTREGKTPSLMLSERLLFSVDQGNDSILSVFAEEQKEGKRRGCHLVVLNGSSANAVEKIEKIPVDGF